MSVWLHVLHRWKAERPKPHPSAEQSEVLNAFILWGVNEESRLPCCVLETGIRLKVCSLGGRNKEGYIELKKSVDMLREEWRNRNHILFFRPWWKISFSYLALLWWRSVSCAQGGDLQTHSVRSALFNTVTVNHRVLLTFPEKEILIMGCFAKEDTNPSVFLCARMYVLAELLYLLSSYVKHFHSKC